MNYIYRVCVLYPKDVDHLPIPGGRYGFTGFWTPREEAAFRLLEWRNEAMCMYENGLTWSVVVRVPVDKVALVPPPPGKKSGHQDWLDEGEVFLNRPPALEDIEAYTDLSQAWIPVTKHRNYQPHPRPYTDLI
jgi:hypothetical protein